TSDEQYVDGKSDWSRLKEYCTKNNLSISNMNICFRDHIVNIPEGKHYFFRRMCLTSFGENERENNTYQYFIVGSTNTLDKITVKKYLVPEIVCMEEEERILKDEESLI